MAMVERTARAICAADDWTAREFDDFTRDERARYAAMARAAIAAMREPTAGMLVEADAAMRARIVEGPSRFRTLRNGYNAMIDAALTSSEPQAPSSE
jgi:hypothetical protein